jgi:hypothetical protein
MKDDVTALLEALRLVELELTHHERGRQGATEALDRVKHVVRETRVQRALDELVMVTNAPSIAPGADVFADA